METIIIFTDYDSIYSNLGYKLSWVPKEEELKVININAEKTFLVAYHQITDLSAIIKAVANNSNVYVLHHEFPIVDKIESLTTELQKKNCVVKCINKHHYDNEYKMIPQIDQFAVNEQTTNKSNLEKAFDELKAMLSGNPKLEASLEFLHKCLIEKPADLSLLNIAFNFKERDIIKIDFAKFKSNENDTLIPLRDTLLKLSGM